ncbi:hypothetical protein R3W88_029717 [Solanum pinnatisectum]|uniref:Large ribosomal subunit protein uL2 C-terminal domain-containing protein n=1 Tax=Solanum pinnatisectum TaxID=50273 RepID=A0AAV9K9M7_9SOLN|nr:hypothetical protein R3W88_029717 [Solanum pinnatisectum]
MKFRQSHQLWNAELGLGVLSFSVSKSLCGCGQLARAAGAVAKLIAKEGKSATLKLPSGEVLGQLGNVRVNQKSLGRAGSKRWLGKRHVVKGVVMNPIDHPHGGTNVML